MEEERVEFEVGDNSCSVAVNYFAGCGRSIILMGKLRKIGKDGIEVPPHDTAGGNKRLDAPVIGRQVIHPWTVNRPGAS